MDPNLIRMPEEIIEYSSQKAREIEARCPMNIQQEFTLPSGRILTGFGPQVTSTPRMLEKVLQAAGDMVGDSHFKRLDNAYIVKDSPRGVTVVAEADTLKNSGNQALADNNLAVAMKFYCGALDKALDVVDNRIQLSILYSNMSYVLRRMGNYRAAQTFATYCVNIRPEWYKAHLRGIEASIDAGEFSDMFLACGNLIMFDLPSEKERGKIYGYYIKCAANVKDGYRVLRHTETRPVTWRIALSYLAAVGEWNILCVLFGVGDVRDVDPDVTSHGPIVSSDVAGDVELYRVLEECGSGAKWKKWGEKLVVALIDKGADWRSISKDGKCGAHVIMRQTINTDTMLLLKKVLPKIPKSELDEPDDKGHTVLRLASSKDYSCRSRVMEMLMESGADPITRNNDGADSHDLIQPSKTNHEEKADIMQDKVSLADMTSWTNDDVTRWLSEHGLGDVIDRFRDLQGPHLVELRIAQEQAPNFFLRSVQKYLGLNFSQTLTFSAILRRI